jgi:hypothetical protein
VTSKAFSPEAAAKVIVLTDRSASNSIQIFMETPLSVVSGKHDGIVAVSLLSEYFVETSEIRETRNVDLSSSGLIQGLNSS